MPAESAGHPAGGACGQYGQDMRTRAADDRMPSWSQIGRGAPVRSGGMMMSADERTERARLLYESFVFGGAASVL
ncbi:MAG: hypothetical protein ACLPUO_25970, partial [Streptosporangiaceae bacterium]